MGDEHVASAERGVYRTTNGGKSWKRILFTNEKSGCAELVMNSNNTMELYAAMYEHNREPWGFKSGGEGSGLYKTNDGGMHWQKLDEKNGLPGPEVGRIGISISKNKSNVVYSLIEAKEKSGIYKTYNGGKEWSYLGNRNLSSTAPYFSEIYSNPMNENTVWSLNIGLWKSYNGGHSFESVSPASFHSDYQAIWISPLDSNLIMLGDDGWFGVTHDGGKVWSTAETIVAGQAYEVSTDDEIPYNVMGGFQDNGSKYGPAYYPLNKNRYDKIPSIISNATWKSIWGGDGFSVVKDGFDSKQYYAMCQEGRLTTKTDAAFYHRFDSLRDNGYRFGWNTPLKKDPFDFNTLYVGSQYLLKSKDAGITWEKISNDLTGNDSSKWVPAFLERRANSAYSKELMKKQTSDFGKANTSLEGYQHKMFSTISTIAPSKIKKGLIWIGSDDGKISMTKNGCKDWLDCTMKLEAVGLPGTCFIDDICASEIDENVAYVVANNYKNGDYSSYLFKTLDGGNTWQRIADDKKIGSVLLSVIQDPVQSNLLFVGASDGLWVSIDGGESYHHWVDGFVPVPVTAMTIQEREADLVLATWGRSFWILDDITPLRELAANPEIFIKPFYLFKPIECRYTTTASLSEGMFDLDNFGWQGGRQRDKLKNYQTNDRPGAYSLSFFYNKRLRKDTNEIVSITVSDIGKGTKEFKINAVDGFNRVWIDYEFAGTLEHSQGLCKAVAQCGLMSDSVQYSLKIIGANTNTILNKRNEKGEDGKD